MDSLHRPNPSPGSVIAYSGIDPAPWRNGGGVTRQIASGTLAVAGNPETVSGNDWDWRISIAEVGTAGDFSLFKGMSRILMVIDGGGLALSIDGDRQQLELFTPLHFDGGSTTSALLPHGPIRDLNLMTRTGVVDGDAAIVELSEFQPLRLSGGRFGILLQGRGRLLAPDGTERDLERFDTVVGGGHEAPLIAGHGTFAVLSVSPSAGSPAHLWGTDTP